MVSIHGNAVGSFESKGAYFLAQMSLAQRTRALKTQWPLVTLRQWLLCCH